MGIGIDDSSSDISKFPFWGGRFEDSHVYIIDFIGKGMPISLNYHDCIHEDNSGFMTAEIFKPLPPQPPDIWTYPLTLTVITGAISIAGVMIAALIQRKRRRRK